MTKHTYDMGVVGNCAFLALIGTDTAVRWLCWPRFDSSFVFGPLLDEQKGGEYSVRPAKPDFSSHQYYVPNTNVLCTEITAADGSYRVTDFAPRFLQYERYYKPLMFIRKIEPLAGTPRVRVACRPVGEYGARELTRRRSSNHIAFLGMEEEIRLTTNIPLTYVLDEEDFVLNETKYLVLTYGAPLEAPLETTAERFLTNTLTYWRNWVKSTSISNFHQSMVIRSALALKIHQYEDTGAIIAASTTSLPEAPGSTRNWDYRFCWMRDTFYILTAFNNIGHSEELERYFHFIANITGKVEAGAAPSWLPRQPAGAHWQRRLHPHSERCVWPGARGTAAAVCRLPLSGPRPPHPASSCRRSPAPHRNYYGPARCRPLGISPHCPEALLHLPLSLGRQPRRRAGSPLAGQ
jgi:GH15 family glucan-1,4-alpha-glucosidase